MKHFLLGCLLALTITSCAQDPTVSTTTKDIASATFWSSSSTGVHLEIFADYQCGACQNFHSAIDTALQSEIIEPKSAKVTFYHLPLESIHKNARRDALASLCALSQGKFREFQHLMYGWERAQSGAKTRDSDRNALAKKVAGISSETFAQCLQEGWYLAQVDKEVAIANDRGVQGTPSVFVDGIAVNLSGNPLALIDIIKQRAAEKK